MPQRRSSPLFPPHGPEDPAPLPLHAVESGGVRVDAANESPAGLPPRATRTRLLVGLLVLLVVLQSALLVWWMQSDRSSIGVAATSSVTVTSEPSGSAVVVDGSGVGVTPLTTALAAGTHQLQVGDEAPQTITVDAGANSSLHVILARAGAAGAAIVGSVAITTNPPGAAVTVDGVPRGVSPVQVPGLTPGTHAVTLARAGRLLRRTVSVEAGRSTSLAVTMDGTARGPGWLTVTSPVPAQIYAGGNLVGVTDTPRVQLPAGRHQLVLVNDALNFREERIVEVAPGHTVSLQLEPVRGTLNINAQPWATVWVDGTAIGETPIGNYSLPIGSHEVVLRHPEFGERRQQVVIGVGAPARVGVDLRR
jgi:hypothetical protein